MELDKNFGALKKNVKFYELHINEIVDLWLSYPHVEVVFSKYSIDKTYFKNEYALQIVNYYISIINNPLLVGSCPVVNNFLLEIKDKDIHPDELYTICTHLRKAIVMISFNTEIMNKTVFDEISYIVDRNIEGVMQRYKAITEEKNEIIQNQQLSLQQYKDAIDAGTIVSKTNPKGRITYVNDKFVEIYGYSREELIGKPHSIVRHPDMPKSFFFEMWETLNAKKIWSGVIQNKTKNGDNNYVNETIFPILNSQGEIVEFVGIKQDLTEVITLHQELENTQKEIIYKMGEVCEMRSKETGNHVKRVALYSKLLALKYGLSEEEANLLHSASPMHDIGKVGIPDEILKKPGKLTDEEWVVMKTHAKIGYEILKSSERPILKAASVVSYEHHEKYDGSGYPRGLRGEDIHIYGRITALADVFDALGSDRVYKKAWELDKIITLVQEESGKHFDPHLVKIFLDNLDEFLEIRDSLQDIDSQ